MCVDVRPNRRRGLMARRTWQGDLGLCTQYLNNLKVQTEKIPPSFYRPSLAGLRLRLQHWLRPEPCQTMGFAAAPHKEPRLELVAAFIREAEPRLCGFKRLRVRPSQNTPSHRPCAQMELRRPNKARRRRLQAPRGGAWMRCCPAPRRLARLPSSYRARLRPPAATGARPSGERRLLLRAASLPPHCDRAASGDCSTPTSARPPFPEGSKLASQHPLVVTVALADGDTQAVLQGLTGHAEPGTITALMGPSGSGKSTLLDALAGRLAANAFLSGTILLNGRKANLSFGAAVRYRRLACPLAFSSSTARLDSGFCLHVSKSPSSMHQMAFS